MLRREDQIALEGEHPIGRRPHSLQHPEVVRRMAEGRVGIDRRVAGAQAPERGHEGREDRRDAERLVLGFARVPLVPGSDAPGRARAGDGRLEHRHERAAPAREVTEEVAVEREIPQANGLPRKGVVDRKIAVIEQMPDVLERPAECEVDRVVAAVDEPPGPTVDEGERRLGDGHVLEAAGRARCPGVDVADARRVDELAQRHEAHQPSPIDDRDVAEAPVQHLLEGVGDAVGRREGEGRPRHPRFGAGGDGMGAGGQRGEGVALRDDADHLALLDDHRRADAAPPHGCGDLGERGRRRSRQRVGRHDLAQTKLAHGAVRAYAPRCAQARESPRAGGIASPRPWTGGNGLPLPAGIDLARNRAPCTS